MSKTLTGFNASFTVHSSEHLPEKDGEQMCADDVADEVRDAVRAAVAGRGEGPRAGLWGWHQCGRFSYSRLVVLAHTLLFSVWVWRWSTGPL